MKGTATVLLITPLFLVAFGAPSRADDYEASIQTWRQNREARLKGDEGWLTVAGLYWLKEGDNSMGTDPSSAIVLPEGSAPAKVGVITYRGGAATFAAAPDVTVTSDGKPVKEMPLRDDTAETTDVLSIADLRFFVIARDGRHAVRLRDLNSPLRKGFTGLSWYPIDASWKVEAAFVPYDPPRTLKVPNILGYVEEQPCPGYAVWKRGDQELRLEPVLSEDGKVVLDFNKAYTPPCAFTPHATCPLPPENNRLTARIDAGELNYGHH